MRAPYRQRALSHQAHQIYAKLYEAAEKGQPAPSNAKLYDALELAHPSDASRFIGQLERAGRIRIASNKWCRVVTIVDTGRSTASGRGNTPRLNSAFGEESGFRGPAPEHQRVDRDPCPRCGVRADVGCLHTASRLVTVLRG